MIISTLTSVFVLFHTFLFSLLNQLASGTADLQQQGTCVSEYLWTAFVFSRSVELLQTQYLNESAINSYIS